ncbi:hypothetical protein [Marisediminicola antarctica]|uniref:Uncharacterized protein n=1 Tax=Marisediminicola antarctica TaxID=674079 RepID=A0A7L5AG10_9MICO|nr:hypothetical protein [Marisediminicola antarctica]QHO68906.1 hypothetical protein BHD05_03890 [Marisediminicola antarctica]
MADENGWPLDWLNTNAGKFIPRYGADPEWETIYSSDDITVEVASSPALPAMKLNASRPGRDTQDIAKLLALWEIPDIEAAEQLLSQFYPGDGLPDRALRILGPVFAQRLPAAPETPPFPVLGLLSQAHGEENYGAPDAHLPRPPLSFRSGARHFPELVTHGDGHQDANDGPQLG